MKRVYIAEKDQVFMPWTAFEYKKMKISKHDYENIFFLINSNRICEISFYDRGFYNYFNENYKIHISNKSIEKYLYFINEK